MQIGPRLQDYVRAFLATRTMVELEELLQAATLELGYDRFTMIQHIDFAGSLDGAVVLSTFDIAWVRRVISRRYFHFDPVIATSHRYGAPFAWNRIPELIDLTRRQRRMFDEARRFGIVDGLTVPLHRPGQRLATCTFVSAESRIVRLEQLAIAQVVASFAYQAALDLVRGNAEQSEPVPLTERQIDCITLSAAGKTDWEIGRILGISESTAHSHMMRAMKRYGVFNRQQLIFHALRDGHISFSDVASC